MCFNYAPITLSKDGRFYAQDNAAYYNVFFFVVLARRVLIGASWSRRKFSFFALCFWTGTFVFSFESIIFNGICKQLRYVSNTIFDLV